MSIKSTTGLAEGIVSTMSGVKPQLVEGVRNLQAKVTSFGEQLEYSEDTTVKEAKPPIKHVAIIMDGNGRWAEERGLPRTAGHREGVAAARRAIETAQDLGLTHLTLYSFSTENWGRPESEVRDLMGLMRSYIESDLPRLIKENVRVKIIGDKKNLPTDIRILVERAERKTAHNTGHFLQIAFNYGGRDEILRAVRSMAREVRDGKLSIETIDETDIASALDTNGIPDPDLVIRTSGERRVSNFLLWQAAYSEYVFLDEYWPDFTRDVFVKAIEEYYARDRRFGRRNTG